MVRQHDIARKNDFTFVRTANQLRHFVDLGLLVPMPGNADYVTAGVSHPFTRPETATFIRRLAAQYRDACGQRLVVTSLTRPVNEQPRNASPLSVHPAGMAADLRVPASPTCRRWLESALLDLENRGVLDVTREQHPPHLHVAVFPDRYMTYAAPLIAADSIAAERERAAEAAAEAAKARARPVQVAAVVPVGEPTPGHRPLPAWIGVAAMLGFGGAGMAQGIRLRHGRSESRRRG